MFDFWKSLHLLCYLTGKYTHVAAVTPTVTRTPLYPQTLIYKTHMLRENQRRGGLRRLTPDPGRAPPTWPPADSSEEEEVGRMFTAPVCRLYRRRCLFSLSARNLSDSNSKNRPSRPYRWIMERFSGVHKFIESIPPRSFIGPLCCAPPSPIHHPPSTPAQRGGAHIHEYQRASTCKPPPTASLAVTHSSLSRDGGTGLAHQLSPLTPGLLSPASFLHFSSSCSACPHVCARKESTFS